jgi:hypothetical protein
MGQRFGGIAAMRKAGRQVRQRQRLCRRKQDRLDHPLLLAHRRGFEQ